MQGRSGLDVERLRDRLESVKGLRLFILYGSLAEGFSHRGSDVDLLVDCDEESMGELYDILRCEFQGREPHIVRARWLKPEALLRTARRGIVLVDRDELGRLVGCVAPDYSELQDDAGKAFETWLRGDPVDRDMIMSIISQIEEDLEILAELGVRLDEVLRDPVRRRAFERALHTSIEGMLDLLKHIVSRVAPGSFETYRELVEKAVEKGIMMQETAKALTDLVEARKILVHRYRGIKDQFLTENLGKASRLWPVLKEEVKGYLRRILS